MTVQAEAIVAGGATPPETVKVWDPFVRIFHWSLVALVVFSLATGDHVYRAHVSAGYAMIGLIAGRVLWGFVGTRYARFADFVRSPRETLGYLADVVSLRSRRYVGHNPAGGLMIIALLTTLAGLAATGYMMTIESFWGVDWIEEVHETLASGLIALIAIHVFGAVLTSLMHRENLVAAMITGRKRAK
jgi:cytochrome b